MALIQYDIVWEDVECNIKRLTKIIYELPENVDLIVLPEMFCTGFSMNTAKIAQTMDGEVVAWMKKIARDLDVVIMGTIAIKEEGLVYNRAVFIEPDGNVQCYNKRHLFRMGKENESYTLGKERKVFECKGVRVMPQVCYDLRFPVWSRNKNEYDVLIYMANWPKSRRYVWDVLLKARAIENQAFVMGVNTIGVKADVGYSGDSMAIDYKGIVITSLGNIADSAEVVEIDMDALNLFREKFPVHLDADEFSIQG
ncbi:amidohydrolase [Labilibacter sediminis]|nr:amidohydrolase [Labilibacter sediminis]